MEKLKSALRTAGRWLVRYPAAAIAAIFVLVAGAVFLILGKNLDIGGLIGKLFGSKQPDLRGVPPEDRKDEHGKPIVPGESDSKGFVQAPGSVGIKDQGILESSDTVTVTAPDGTDEKIDLPIGVKNKDVREVIVVKPGIQEVKNKDKGADTTDLLNILGKK